MLVLISGLVGTLLLGYAGFKANSTALEMDGVEYDRTRKYKEYAYISGLLFSLVPPIVVLIRTFY